jgi:hypothetical protein
MRCVAEEREAEANTGGEDVIVFNRVKAGPEDLHVALREGLIEGVKSAPFGAASPGVGFGIKPQDHLFAAEICQAHGGAIMRRHGKIRRLGLDCKQLWPSQDQTKSVPD